MKFSTSTVLSTSNKSIGRAFMDEHARWRPQAQILYFSLIARTKTFYYRALIDNTAEATESIEPALIDPTFQVRGPQTGSLAI